MCRGRSKKEIKYSARSRHPITVKDLEEIAKDEGIEFRTSDILLGRTGWIKWYHESSPEERTDGSKTHQEYVGVEGSEQTLEWLWDHHFAALVDGV